MTGCVMEGLFKHANDAMRRVLEVNHCQSIEVAKQVCCGALHAHSGDLETARKLHPSEPTLVMKKMGRKAIALRPA